ncbi:MAG: ABC transporter ATP-binding protein [Planctomycetota bacterium]
MIRIENITKRFGSFTALENVTFNVAPREIFGLVGPNGAGKSTLIKILAGIVRPTSGRAFIDNFCVESHGAAARRRMGYLPSDGNLYESMTPRVFLQYALSGYERCNLDLRDELLELFHIPNTKKIRDFSHGMKRKLGIIQAVVPDVPLAVLDEPEEGLDPTVRQKFLILLFRLRDGGKTILLSSHQLESVSNVCDRVAFLAGGKLLDCDHLTNIRERAGRRIRVRLQPGADAACLQLNGVESVVERNGEYIVIAKENPHDVLKALAQLPVDGIEYKRLRLEEVYSDLYQIERPS